SIQNSVRVPNFYTSTVIFYHAIRMKNIGTNLTAPSDILFSFMEIFHLFLLFLHLKFVKTRTQNFHRSRAVLMLRAFVLTGDNDAGWQMRQSHSRVGFIDMLPACAPRPIGVDAQIFWSDVNLNRIV